ncbi:MAG: DUF4349 domain-containing protein [Propionicimonas sp.]|uniref:DUF4349 domain-containing protein n=1 Tax=Propionicimonas sp. TaxID=1955623 RepID=UPI003D1116FA
MRNMRALAAAAIVPTLVLLAGCSGSSSGAAASLPEDVRAADGSVAEDAGGAPADVPAGEPNTTLTPQLARTARISLTVTDVEAAATRLRELAASMGGQVTSENLVSRDDSDPDREPTSTMVLQVPADHLDATLDEVARVGTLTNRVISSEDVSTEVADVDARLKTLDASIDRLRELSKRAGTIRELTELESELTSRIAERDSLAAQQRVLSGRVAQSPITITLRTPAPASSLETTGFLGGLLAGWNALLASSRMLMTAVGAVLPFLVVAGVVAVPVLVIRRRRRRGPAAPSAPEDASRTPESEE